MERKNGDLYVKDYYLPVIATEKLNKSNEE